MGKRLIAEASIVGSLNSIGVSNSLSNPAFSPLIPNLLRSILAIDCFPLSCFILQRIDDSSVSGSKSQYIIAKPDKSISSRREADSL